MADDKAPRRMPEDDGRLARATALAYVLAAVAVVAAILFAWWFGA